MKNIKNQVHFNENLIGNKKSNRIIRMNKTMPEIEKKMNSLDMMLYNTYSMVNQLKHLRKKFKDI